MTKRTFFLGLSALSLWSFSEARAQGQQSKELIRKEFTLTGSAGRSVLALYNINGSVTVQGYAGSQVLVEATKTVTARDARALEVGKAEARLGFTQRGDSLVV